MQIRELKEIIFDFEVFKNDWFVTFLDNKTNETITFRNDSLNLIDYIEKNKWNSCFIGHNNKFFDNHCIKCIYHGINPYRVVDWVIKKGQSPWTLPELRFKKNVNDFISYDVMNDNMSALQLKEVEANLGMKIEEMNFDMEYGGRLPDEVYKNLLEYNKWDCKATQAEFNKIKDDYISKKTIIELYDKDYSYLIKTYPGLIGDILNCRPFEQPSEYVYSVPKCIDIKDKSIIKEYTSHISTWKKDEFEFTRKIQDVIYTFALGGGHGALENLIYETKDDYVIVCADVHNLYLNLMINNTNPEFQFYSKAIGSPHILQEIKNKREEYKVKGNKILAAAYKKALVPIYGSMLAGVKTPYGYKQSILTDWINGRNVCITGQLCLYDLAEKCAELPTSRLFNLNTDGIYLIINKNYLDRLNKIFDEWQKRTGLVLETEIIKHGKIVQKDVNNYILYNKDTDEIKVKGKDVKQWQGGNYSRNDKSIVAEAIVKYFVYNKPINETVLEALDKNEAIKFQIVCARKGKNFTATYWGDKVVQKVNRIFPVCDESKPFLSKLKDKTKHRFQDVPDHCIVDNRDIKDINLKDINLDINYYLTLINKKIKDFKGI